jgi:hypothetical protein
MKSSATKVPTGRSRRRLPTDAHQDAVTPGVGEGARARWLMNGAATLVEPVALDHDVTAGVE